MELKDNFLWHALALMGINIAGYRLEVREKLLSIMIVSALFSLMSHWTAANFFFVIRFSITGGLAYILLSIKSFLIWYFLIAKRKVLTNIVQKLYMYHTKYNAREYNSSYFIKAILITMLLLPTLISTFLRTAFEFELVDTHAYWIFEHEIQNNILREIVNFYGNLLHFTCCTFTVFLTLSLCMVFYRWGDVLAYYNKLLKAHFQTKTLNQCLPLLKEFFDIINTLRKLNKVLSYHSFLVIVWAVATIFTTVFAVVMLQDMLARPVYLTEIIFNCVCGILMLVSYTLCCSIIPEQLDEIKKTSRDLVRICGCNHFIFREITFYLSRIEKEDIVNISACGLFELRRGFILTAIGTTLTYDLLIISFNNTYQE